MKLKVVSRSGRELVVLDVSSGGGVDDLIAAMSAAKPKYYPSRCRFSLLPKEGESRGQALASGKKLSDYDLSDNATVQFKDLGPQIGYQTVFFWEYFGPMTIYPLFYLLPDLLYPGSPAAPPRHEVQTLACAYWVFHFAKRIAETFLVHRFSHATMPLANLFRNCTYYWGFAAFVSYFINHPLYTPPDQLRCQVSLGIALLCQAGNLWCHIILSNLRPPGSKEYRIPSGFLFNFITCANYTTEIYGWFWFNVATQSLGGVIYMVCGAGQMALWAIAKHARLRKLFDGKDGRPKYPKRWIMLPPVL
jgi:very-long-chain enoyl-CoA reductase